MKKRIAAALLASAFALATLAPAALAEQPKFPGGKVGEGQKTAKHAPPTTPGASG